MKKRIIAAMVLLVLACEGNSHEENSTHVDWLLGLNTQVGKGDSPWVNQGGDLDSGMDWANDPGRVVAVVERRLEALPTSGQATKVLWSGSYWPRYKGGIGYRWNGHGMATVAPGSAEEARMWSREQVAALSPSKKYDLSVGNYDYSLHAKTESMNTPGTPEWQGYCHGWSMASIHFEEPGSTDMINPDGIVIPFGASDVKALLTFYQGDVVRSEYGSSVLGFTEDVEMGGGTCLSSHPEDPSCTDTNPGTFHLVMANQVGIHRQAFGIDATPHREKWNQPVFAYTSQILGVRMPGPGAQPLAEREAIVRSEVTYAMEIEPRWDKVLQTEAQHNVTKVYTYTLELDGNGEIIGGQWILLMEDKSTPTMEQAWNYLLTVDENGDGFPDYKEEAAKSVFWGAFDFPDYVWFQEKGTFADSFQPAWNRYAFLANSESTRKAMYHYFAPLKDIYEASLTSGPF